jgi:prepilin-type N-terminal cleavage/methylation domain-containing protein
MRKKSRKAFTIMEMMIAMIVMAMLMLSALSYMTMFMELSDEAEMKEKFSYYSTELQKNLSDLDFIKKIMSNQDGHTVPKAMYRIKYGTSDPIIYKDVGNNDITIDKTLIENFWGTDSISRDKFLDGLYVYVDSNSTIMAGDIKADYKTYTLIYVGDPMANRILKNKILDGGNFVDLNVLIDGMFDKIGGYLVLKDVPDTTAPTYMQNNWNNIKSKLLMVKVSTKRKIMDVILQIDKDMTKVQERINDWATIQASYASYDTGGTGNTLDNDYFITCVDDGDSFCDNVSLPHPLYISSKKTLIKNDVGTSPNINGGLNFNKITTGVTQKKFKNIPIEYGFIIFSKDIEDNTVTLNDFQPTTEGCSTTIEDKPITINVDGAGILSVGLIEPEETDYCTFSENIRRLVPPNLNPFGYPVYFTNWTEYAEDGTVVADGVTGALATNIFMELNGNTLGQPVSVQVNTPIIYNNGTTTFNIKYAPYDAKIFTLLPNGEVVTKQVYAKGF